MKIAIISPGELPVPNAKGGGVESLIQMIIDENEISNLMNITLFSIFDSTAYEQSKRLKNTEVIFIKKNPVLDKIWRYVCAILKRLIRKRLYNRFWFYLLGVKLYLKKRNHYDIFLVENNIQFVDLIDKITNKYIIFHTHNDDIKSIHSKQLIDYQRNCIYKCKAVLSVSDFIKDEVVKATEFKNVITLKNCIDLDAFSESRHNSVKLYKERYGINQEDIVIMYSGRVIKEKGVRELVEAYANINTEKSIKLLIVGGRFYSDNNDDNYILSIRKLCSQMENKVIFTQYISYDDMPILYQLADIVVLPTLYFEEAAGLVCIEAMVNKKPLIVSKSGGIPEYASKDCAIQIERDDRFVQTLTESMEFLIENKDVRIKMGNCGRNLSEKYGKKDYYKNFYHIIKNQMIREELKQ